MGSCFPVYYRSTQATGGIHGGEKSAGVGSDGVIRMDFLHPIDTQVPW